MTSDGGALTPGASREQGDLREFVGKLPSRLPRHHDLLAARAI